MHESRLVDVGNIPQVINWMTLDIHTKTDQNL